MKVKELVQVIDSQPWPAEVELEMLRYLKNLVTDRIKEKENAANPKVSKMERGA